MGSREISINPVCWRRWLRPFFSMDTIRGESIPAAAIPSLILQRLAAARLGAAYEMVDDCQADLAAWVGLLQSLGYRQIGLLGHSLGAVKAAFYACHRGLGAIDRLVCISPPRLVPEILASDARYASNYAQDLQQAKECMAIGKPESLLTIRYPQPMLISAATFLDKYGRSDQHDYVRMAGQIAVPSLWCFGEKEIRGHRASFRNADQVLMEAVAGMNQHQVRVIANADHAYSHAQAELSSVIGRWISEKI